MSNIACRIFKEQMDLINELPESERGIVLYTAVQSAFNQIENQNDNQNDFQNENAYVSVSVSVSVLGNTIIKLLSKSIICKEFSNNYGGRRYNSGRKNAENRQKNQIENQIENQFDNQIENQIDNQNENQIEKKQKITPETKFQAGYQNWQFAPSILLVAKKYWKTETIRNIERDFSCNEYATETSIQELLQIYPSDISKGFKKPTIDEIKAYINERKSAVDATKFFNYYESNGWKVGKNPMKNWKAAVITWEKSGYNTSKGKTNPMMDASDDNFLRSNPAWWLDENQKD